MISPQRADHGVFGDCVPPFLLLRSYDLGEQAFTESECSAKKPDGSVSGDNGE